MINEEHIILIFHHLLKIYQRAKSDTTLCGKEITDEKV